MNNLPMVSTGPPGLLVVPPFSTPRTALELVVGKGIELREKWALPLLYTGGPGARALARAGRKTLSLLPRTKGVRNVKKFLEVGHEIAAALAWQEISRFFRACETLVCLMSCQTKALKRPGRSDLLLRKFNRAKRYKHPVRALDEFLEKLVEIHGHDLVWNADIPVHVPRPMRLFVSSANPLATDGASSLPIGLSRYSEAARMWAEASEMSKDAGSGQCRGAIVALRASIESASKSASGERGWRSGVKALLTCQDSRRVVFGAHGYLSAKGAHSDHTPSQQDVSRGFNLARAALEVLLA